MTKKIESSIVGFEVLSTNPEPSPEESFSEPQVHYLDQELGKRNNGPLFGLTMRVKNTTSDEAAIYVTCNFAKMEQGAYRLSEVFLNCKDATNLQWATVTTRQMSALARRTGRIGFMIEEMKQVSDAAGGYRVYIDENDPKPIFVRSTVAHIGHCIERACIQFDVIDKSGGIKNHPNDYQPPINLHYIKDNVVKDAPQTATGGVGVSNCSKCGGIKTIVVRDNCKDCIQCGSSSCS